MLAKSVEFDPIVRTINYSAELSNNKSIGEGYNSNVESIIPLRMVNHLSEGENEYIETDNEILKAGVWGEEWTEEERIRRGKEAYEREEISEVDYNLVEAIPSGLWKKNQK